MNYKNKTLYFLSKKILERNKKFKNIHKGESCYLIGNGASIKYYDLRQFDDKIAIGCNGLFFHSDFNKINVRYYFTGHPYLYYPYWRNPYTGSVERNLFGSLYKVKVRNSKNVSYFINLSNYFSLKGNNIFYIYHFGIPLDGFANSNLDQFFTSSDNGLNGMLGMAIYMGFKDVTLIGCDYAFAPKGNGHFFDYGRFPDLLDEEPHNEKAYRDAQEHIAIRVLIPNDDYKGAILPHISYKELTGMQPDYKENYEIVSKSDLSILNLVNFTYIVFPQDETKSKTI